MLPPKKQEEINYFDAIQIISLNNLFKFRNNKSPTKDYDYGRIFRYYSKTFHTPLHEVYALPLHDVLTAYFDDYFESVDPEELEVIRQDLIKSHEEKVQESDKEEADIFDLMKEVAKEAEQLELKVQEFNKNKNKPKTVIKPPEIIGNNNIKMNFNDFVDNNPNDSLGLLDP